MTDEEKAKELAIKATKYIDDNGKETYNAFVEAALQEMAEWKDEQWRLRAQTAFCASRGCMFQCGTTMCDARIAFDRLISQ